MAARGGRAPRRLGWPAILGLSVLVVLLGSGLALAAAVAVSGVATVSLQDRDEGRSLYLPVPAAMIEGGSIVAAIGMPDEAAAELRRELGEAGPVAVALLAALEEIPDAVLVEVEDRGTHVRVEKRGGRIEVSVDEGEATSVRVSMPIGAARRSLGRLVG